MITYDQTKYLDGLKLKGDSDGHIVANYQIVSEHVAKRLSSKHQREDILEVCCGIGATTIFLAKTFSNVIAVDLNGKRIDLAKENLQSLGLSNVNLINSDIFDLDLKSIREKYQTNVVYTDVEWTISGLYGQDHANHITDTSPATDKLFHFLSKNITNNICMRLPKTIDITELRHLLKCEIEKVYKNNKLSFINCYFGDLVEHKQSEFRFEWD